MKNRTRVRVKKRAEALAQTEPWRMKVADEEDPRSDGLGDVEAIPSDEERAAEPEEKPGEELLEEIEELRKRAAERDEYLELAKRVKADFLNYQKRVEEERKKWATLAQRDLLTRLLTACDQCSVAAKSAGEDPSVESLRDAIRLVWSELERFLRETGVSPVPTEGVRFDPNVHKAVFVQPSSEHPDSTILDEVKPGYLLGDQVLRPAQVVVTKRPAEKNAETELEKGPAEDDNSGDGRQRPPSGRARQG